MRQELHDPILIVGAPRSGTTWLAKIIDSHPDVLYRHEPDDGHIDACPITPSDVPRLMAQWAADRTPRAAAKRPFFPKSYQSAWQRNVRTLLVGAISAAARLPPPLRNIRHLPVPDMMAQPPPRVAIKSIRLAEKTTVFAAAEPACRVVFILRHPCGQVASVMRGNRQQRFELKTAGTDMPFDEAAAIRFAAGSGVTDARFQALSDAAKYAWSWRAFNEPACAALSGLQNVRIVCYETLCAAPEAEARRILAFCALPWNLQTQDFISRSTTHKGDPGYYAIFRNAVAAAAAWQTTMPPDDQQAVQAVLAGSPLAHYWQGLGQVITR
ncbi:MAG TPA: sulfotransferase [Rhodopila sp.]|nr:sulfotransferase [Rhodopila sp.]